MIKCMTMILNASDLCTLWDEKKKFLWKEMQKWMASICKFTILFIMSNILLVEVCNG